MPALINDVTKIDLSASELRAVVRFAVACARPALLIFANEQPADTRPHAAIDAAQAFADGAERTKALRDSAWGALRAASDAQEAGHIATSEAARAAMAAAGAAYLHPIRKATQVKHILGSAAHAARAFEVAAGEAAGASRLAELQDLAETMVVNVLRRYPAAPTGGGRIGELIRLLDLSLRETKGESWSLLS